MTFPIWSIYIITLVVAAFGAWLMGFIDRPEAPIVLPLIGAVATYASLVGLKRKDVR